MINKIEATRQNFQKAYKEILNLRPAIKEMLEHKINTGTDLILPSQVVDVPSAKAEPSKINEWWENTNYEKDIKTATALYTLEVSTITQLLNEKKEKE